MIARGEYWLDGCQEAWSLLRLTRYTHSTHNFVTDHWNAIKPYLLLYSMIQGTMTMHPLTVLTNILNSYNSQRQRHCNRMIVFYHPLSSKRSVLMMLLYKKISKFRGWNKKKKKKKSKGFHQYLLNRSSNCSYLQRRRRGRWGAIRHNNTKNVAIVIVRLESTVLKGTCFHSTFNQ